ncbi:hypothetical protein KW429_23690, partial [Vibrio fluvialis]|nr:hypothetical protein [Vibrio fluvialis]
GQRCGGFLKSAHAMCERFEMKERVYHEALLVIQALVAPDTRYPAAFCTRDFIQQCQLCGELTAA